MSDYPEDLKYSADHEWVRPGNDTRVRVGVTDYAAEQLGDIVYISLPESGTEVEAGNSVGELESTKSVSDLVSPVTGVVVSVNDVAADAPQTVNSDPYGDGWLFEVEVSDESALADLLDSDEYAAQVNA